MVVSKSGLFLDIPGLDQRENPQLCLRYDLLQ